MAEIYMNRRNVLNLIVVSAGYWLIALQATQAQQMHYLGIAASSRESVFQSEATGAGATVGKNWQLASSNVLSGGMFSRVTLSSVNAAIEAAAGKMDKERDVLFLLVTSHGGPDGAGVELSGGGAMRAGQLRAMLDRAGVKNRVVVISACYSGQFIGQLSGPNTLVMTAANATNPSFGCSNQRSYTYFGDALFNYGMAQRGRDLRSAFAVARTTVTGWEKRDGEQPSQPQISVGARIGKTLQGVK
jgi:Peptidase C13 family